MLFVLFLELLVFLIKLIGLVFHLFSISFNNLILQVYWVVEMITESLFSRRKTLENLLNIFRPQASSGEALQRGESKPPDRTLLYTRRRYIIHIQEKIDIAISN